MAAFLEAIGRLDAAAFQWLRLHHTPLLDSLMAGLSDIARGSALWIALAILIAVLRPSRWPSAVQVFLVLALAFAVTEWVAKPFFNRQRPFETHGDTRVYGYKPTTRSLPSGHAVNAVAGAYALARLAPEGRAIFWTLAMLVGISRVYLGVHYPADVIVGALLGLAIAKFVVGGTQWRFQSQLTRATQGGA